MHTILDTALADKKLSPLEFRALYYIVKNIDYVYLVKLKDDLQIKTNRTMSAIIKSLIKYGYISRTKKNLINKKGSPSFQYTICTAKVYLPKRDNFDTFFKDIHNILDYYKEKINPNSFNEVEAIRNIRLLLHIDNYNISYLKSIIDQIAINEDLKSSIKSFAGIRKYLKKKN